LISTISSRAEIAPSRIKIKPEANLGTRYRDRWQRKKQHAKRPAGDLTTSERQILYNGHTLDPAARDSIRNAAVRFARRASECRCTPVRRLHVRRKERMTSKVGMRSKVDSGFAEEAGNGTESRPESLLHDPSGAAIQTVIERAKGRGYVTQDQIDAALSAQDVTSEQIESVLASLNEMGINVVEHDETLGEDESAAKPESHAADATIVGSADDPPLAATAPVLDERTDDPVRMYLRDMGTTELLSREGETAIARRIEAGREAMIAGLCESPLSFQAVVLWRDELTDGRASLRDIIDLEATYAGPGAKAKPAPAAGAVGQ
jgi:hypothetical protein